jgi:hypothetical protein
MNERIKKSVRRMYGGDNNVRKIIVADRGGKTWVSVHLYANKNEEVRTTCFDCAGLWRRFGHAYQNYRHQFGKPMRVSFSIDKRRLP